MSKIPENADKARVNKAKHPLHSVIVFFLHADGRLKPKPIDFQNFLSCCELNFCKLLKVFPTLFQDKRRQIEMHFQNNSTAQLELTVLERTSHTSLLSLRLFDHNAYLYEAQMQIRVYHDMKVVEVLNVQSVDVRKSSIRKSCNGLIQPNERLQASVLLSEWLGHCLDFGTIPLRLKFAEQHNKTK